MASGDEQADYEERAHRELTLAASVTQSAAKAAHLDLAAKYATMGERSRAPHQPDEEPQEELDVK